MDENEPLCTSCGAACNAVAGARAHRWTVNAAHQTLTGTVAFSEYDAIATGTESQSLVIASLGPDQLAAVSRGFRCQLPPCPMRRVQDRALNHGCVQYPVGYDHRG